MLRILFALLLVGCTTIIYPSGHDAGPPPDAAARVCDGTLMCPSGLRCVSNRCVP